MLTQSRKRILVHMANPCVTIGSPCHAYKLFILLKGSLGRETMREQIHKFNSGKKKQKRESVNEERETEQEKERKRERESERESARESTSESDSERERESARARETEHEKE